MTYEQMKAAELIRKGDKSMSQPKHPYEQEMQMACVGWFDRFFPRLRLYLHHSPNGGKRSLKTASNFKKMGTRAGFPDLLVMIPTGNYPFRFAELKYGKGRQEPAQKDFEKFALGIGAEYIVIREVDQFKDWMLKILSQANEEGTLKLTTAEIRILNQQKKWQQATSKYRERY